LPFEKQTGKNGRSASKFHTKMTGLTKPSPFRNRLKLYHDRVAFGVEKTPQRFSMSSYHTDINFKYGTALTAISDAPCIL
jgi:hypothetical protein